MSDQVIVNLATGLEDAERVTVAFLVGVAAADRGQPVRMFTKEAVRLALKDGAIGVACEGCPPLPDLAERFRRRGRSAAGVPRLLQRPQARRHGTGRAREVAGNVPLFDWIGGEAATVFSY